MLKAHAAALQTIKTEILFKNATLADILPKLKSVAGGHVAGFYRRVFEKGISGGASVSDDMLREMKRDGLKSDDIEAISLVCSILGRYDAAAQAEAITRAAALLEGNLDMLRKDMASKGKLYNAIGAAAGIVLALIVI